MKIAIIGIGFVGGALLNCLKGDFEVMKIDPKLKTKIIDLERFNPDITFITVPTPMNDDGTQDISILNSVFDELKDIEINSLIVLKSTVLPDTINVLEKNLDRFVYNPEFLREKTALQDFIDSPFLIFGGKEKNCKELSDFYSKYTLCKTDDHIFVDAVAASFVKYTINSFLAMKVIFFNQLFDLFNKSNSQLNWQELINLIGKDQRIGKSHMQVPGHDGRRGFGGACFPKDTKALYEYSKTTKTPFSLLENIISINNEIRLSYNDQTEREKDQNIKFFDDF
tara:strand:- start:223 stop:1068 length:846 start_codon:yes stop_codon:yes gene_type:complete